MDVENIQRLLESKLVQYKLSKLGLTKDEIQERLHQLDNEQLHLIASQIHTLEPGGFDPVCAEGLFYLGIIAVLLVAWLVYTIVECFKRIRGAELDGPNR